MSIARFVLDTNVVVQILRWNEIGRRIDARFGLLASPVPPMISAVSLGEARSLARQWSWGAEKVAQLHALLLRFVVVDIRTEPVVAHDVEIDHGSRSLGRRMNQNDLWIAAIGARSCRPRSMQPRNLFSPRRRGRRKSEGDGVLPATRQGQGAPGGLHDHGTQQEDGRT